MIESSVPKSEVGDNLRNLEIAPPVLHVLSLNTVPGKVFIPSAMAIGLKSCQILRTWVCVIVTFLSIVSQHVTRMMMMMMMISDDGEFHLFPQCPSARPPMMGFFASILVNVDCG